MSTLKLNEIGPPPLPAVGKADIFIDSTLDDHRLKLKHDDGYTDVLSQNGLRHVNFLANGGIAIQQRVAIAATAIPSVSTTTRAGRVADRWAVTVGNVTTTTWQQVDTAGAPETNLASRYYGRITQNTNAAKFIFSQYIANADMTALRGKSVRLSCKVKQFVGANAVYRLGLLRLGAAGTPDVDPTFISAIGAASTDPTWGTNLALVTPTSGIGAENGALSGSAVNITSSANWVRSSAVFDVPSDCENLVFVLFRDTLGAAADSVGITELQITLGQEVVDWVTIPSPFDLSRCLRFFLKSFPSTTVPAASLTEASAGTGAAGIIGKAGATALGVVINVQFPAIMFRLPTITLFTPVGAGAVPFRITGTTPAVQTAVAQRGLTELGLTVTATGDINGAVGDLVGVHYTADAEFVN